MNFVLALILTWQPLQSGVEYARIDNLHVVRVDPSRARVRALFASERGIEPRTAGEWSRAERLAVVINLGMFQVDHRSNVGYARSGKHVNNRRWNSYRSIVAINPGIAWIDLGKAEKPPDLSEYEIVVQNLRLIAGNRRNVWSASAKKWSEAALATDSQGRLLFLFSREPHSMREFNALVMRLPLGITQAMHLEGGPEASLSVHAGGVDLDLCGSFETGFTEHDDNRVQWPIPNVLAVARENP